MPFIFPLLAILEFPRSPRFPVGVGCHSRSANITGVARQITGASIWNRISKASLYALSAGHDSLPEVLYLIDNLILSLMMFLPVGVTGRKMVAYCLMQCQH